MRVYAVVETQTHPLCAFEEDLLPLPERLIENAASVADIGPERCHVI